MKTNLEHYLQFSDAILIRLVCKRCKVSGLAFEGLMKRYKPDAFGIAHSILHHKADEKDAVSEARVQVLQKILKGIYIEMGKFDRYFKSIVSAEGYKILRKRKGLSFGEEVTEYLNECIKADEGINKFEAYQEYLEIRNAMPEKYRAVHDETMKGIPLETIAKNLGIPLVLPARETAARENLWQNNIP
jgi:RNA polymerase sigma factor (sigma-70 family)